MKKKLKKEIIEWIVIIAVLIIMINTGIGTKIASYVQRGILYTGLVTPEVLDEEDYIKASYAFELSDIDGKTIPFSKFKGKTIFINFWATWCPPCIAEMPDINDLHKKLKDQENLVFVMISTDKNRQKAKDFLVNESLELPIYFLQSRLPQVYDAHSIPTTYVISPSGDIVAERHGIAQYDSEEFISFLTGLK